MDCSTGRENERSGVGKDEVSFLKTELNKLKKELYQVRHEKCQIPHDVAIKMIMRKEFSKKYKWRIENFFKDLLRNEKVSSLNFEFVEDEVEENFFFNELAQPVKNGETPIPKLPVYDKTFDEPLGYDKKSKKPPKENKAQGLTCFNCLGNHHLKDCPEAHDGSRIANNKRDLMEAPTIRYHTDDVQPLENSSIRPGLISERLREALSLRPNQLPLYIYTMRILGYPPGWMKEAEIETSGLTVYDSNGNAFEDEDIASSKAAKSKQYNGKKFIEYPGFNTPVPEGLIDEWKTLHMPPLQAHQQLTEALKHKMVTISPEYKKRKKIDNFSRSANKSSKNDSEDLPCTPPRNSDANRGAKKTPNAVLAGSPLIDTKNPYKKLPDSNKFAAGMSEYLPYENLPDAVGAFDKKMRGVLDDVRDKMSKQYENCSEEEALGEVVKKDNFR